MTVRSLALLTATCVAASASGGGGYGSTSPTGTPPSPPAVADQVNATAALAFDPSTLTTKVGHTVTSAFGSVGHNIFFDSAGSARDRD
jgi:plastocyanin